MEQVGCPTGRILRMISGFRPEGDGNCDLLRHYTANSGDLLPALPQLAVLEFLWNFIFEHFSKFRLESSSFIKVGQE